MFREAKGKERVWSLENGWGTIVSVTYLPSYPIWVQFDNNQCVSYTIDGKRVEGNIRESLFYDEIKITPPPRPKRKVKKVVEGYLSYNINKKTGEVSDIRFIQDYWLKCSVQYPDIITAYQPIRHEYEEEE